MAKMGFDSSKVAPAQPFEVLPKGWYPMEIAEAENKEGTNGQRLSIVLSVDAGKAKGRKVFDGINWTHSNSETQRIGQEQLSAICHAVGIKVLEEDRQLVGKKLAVKLGIEEERKDEATGKTYDARNVCKGFKPSAELNDWRDPMELAKSAPPPAGGTPMGAAAPDDAPDWMKNPSGNPATGTQAPAAPADAPPPPVDAAPPAPAQKSDDERLTEAGWKQHPSSAPHWYKGQEVVLKADALAKLAPAAPEAPPAAPPAPAATPAAAPAPAAASAPDSAAAAGDTPPWLQG